MNIKVYNQLRHTIYKRDYEVLHCLHQNNLIHFIKIELDI